MDSYGESPIDELNRFRNFHTDVDNIEIPLSPEHRKETDRKYLIAFVIAIIILLPFLVYTLMHANIRNLSGYDDCGNFCGYENTKYDEWNCTGQDFRDKKYILVQKGNRYDVKSCVESCPNYNVFSCKDNMISSSAKAYEDFSEGLSRGYWVILLSMVITCALCMGMIVLFKYAVDFVVWFLLIGSLGVMTIAAGILWNTYFNYLDKQSPEAKASLQWAWILSIIVLAMVILLSCMIKRVKLIIELFKEAAKSVFEVPCLLYLPIMTFVALAVSLSAWLILTYFLSTARQLIVNLEEKLVYDLTGPMIFTALYNFFMFIWFIQFVVGAQYIIIAGAISAWFFTRNKHYLDAPLWTSFKNFVKYHMGTVFIGSLIITIVQIIKWILRGLASNARTKWLVDCLCNELMAFLKLFSKNAYIQTAMHGQPFFKSGSRALKLVISNVENVIALNSIGDFVLVIAQFLLVVVSGAITYGITWATKQHEAIAPICFVLAVFMVIIFFNIFEATIDSIFMCFCEDTLINDGMARPYYMTKGLHQFVENCKGVIPAKN